MYRLGVQNEKPTGTGLYLYCQVTNKLEEDLITGNKDGNEGAKFTYYFKGL